VSLKNIPLPARRRQALLAAFCVLVGFTFSQIASAQTLPTLDSEEQAFLTLINQYRAQNGLGLLQVSAALTNASKWMSNDMATKNYFSHIDSLGHDPYQRMVAFMYNYNTWAGENIAAGYADAANTFNQWKNSPDHNANMLNPNYKVIGIGRAYNANSTYQWYWTTDFGVVVDQTINPTPCSFSLSSLSQTFASGAGTGSVGVSASSGCSWTAASNDSWMTVSPSGGSGNGTVSYSVLANNGTATRTGTLTIAGQTFTVVQAAPGQFVDVPPTYPYFTEIGKIAARGITVGCGAGNYCPDSAVTREQMAIFIERALGVFSPPTPTRQTFFDVPSTRQSYPFIEDFAQRGITSGCGGGNYCPDSAVTREQMAIFIERALGVFSPPTPTRQTFFDVPSTRQGYAFIEDFARRGITSGCGGGNYCPDSPVTRGQMAVFLVKAFGW